MIAAVLAPVCLLASLTLLGDACAVVPPPAEEDEPLPGEPYEYGPSAGMSLTVVGVDYVEELTLRDAPDGEIIAILRVGSPIAFLLEVSDGASGEPVAWFDSWDGAIVATGRTRRLPDAEWPDAVWYEVQVAGFTGWASGGYLAPLGLSEDVTAQLIDRFGERPQADTLVDLAAHVVEELLTVEPPTRVVIIGPGVFEALGEVTVDVLNIPDDSLLGYRLYISADASEDWMSENPGPLTLRTVWRTIICHSHRGVTTNGLCV